MTAFQRTIFILVLFGLGWFAIQRKPDAVIVYPDACAFTIDPLFSDKMQQKIRNFIAVTYQQDKNIDGMLSQIQAEFSCIKSVVIDMQNPEKLHFVIQAYQPLFLMNEKDVVCQSYQIFGQEIFQSHELAKLERVTFSGLISAKNMEYLVQFFTSLQDKKMLQDCTIRWAGKNTIWLDVKKLADKLQDLSLLVSYQTVPGRCDLEQCQKIQGQLLEESCKNPRDKSCKKNKAWICDLRFDQQIIVFSTNKGV